jgi:phage recombination protein Bet
MSDKQLATQQPASILATVASKYGLAAKNLYDTLADTIFPSKKSATPEQVQSLLIVANQYDLNPFTKEIYAFPGKGGGIVPVVGVDGWLKMANSHPMFDGMDIVFKDDENGTPVSCTCTIYRKDRNHPIVITEYYAENRRTTDPWKTNPHRMLRHRAVIQAIRTAFSFGGIYEPDEAERVIEAQAVVRSAGVVDAVSAALSAPEPEPAFEMPKATEAAAEPVEAQYAEAATETDAAADEFFSDIEV